MRPPFTAVLRPFRLLIGMGEIIDYISRTEDSVGQWAPTVGPLPFFNILWAASFNLASCLITLPYGAPALADQPNYYRARDNCMSRFCWESLLFMALSFKFLSVCVCACWQEENMCLFQKNVLESNFYLAPYLGCKMLARKRKYINTYHFSQS